MSNEELVALAEKVGRDLESEVHRMVARANHRKAAGRKLSAADSEYFGQLRTMVAQFQVATDSLLSDGKAHDLMARHRQRAIQLMDM